MTQEEINNGNKLIAKFVGMQQGKPNETRWATDWFDVDGFIDGARHEKLRFYDSWDWLMEAVEKCLIGEAECNEPVLITNIYDALTSISITGTFVAVVEFIKWYNNQIE